MPFFSKKKRLAQAPVKRDKARYVEERQIAKSSDSKARLALAKSSETHKEVLYYLAEHDPDDKVRKAVAENALTPIQASTVLSKDQSKDVRMALLKRLVHLLPDLSTEEYSSLYAHAVQSLSNLALDEVIKIKRTLSATLKDKGYTPPQVAAQLAKDVERQVSEPILKYCITVPDEDLIKIVSHTKYEWVARAIAQRKQIEENVSDAVVKRADCFPKAGEDLLSNEGASIASDTLQYIIEIAKDRPEWHKPLATRSDLPPEMAFSIAGFVSDKLRNMMLSNNEFDEETRDEIEKTAKRRMTFLKDENGKSITALQKLEQLVKSNALDDEAIGDAIALKEEEFVLRALAYRSKISPEAVQSILDTKAPKTIVSLCWMAQIPMRMAFMIQQDLVKVSSREILYPKQGKHYPLTEEQMRFQINFFTER